MDEYTAPTIHAFSTVENATNPQGFRGHPPHPYMLRPRATEALLFVMNDTVTGISLDRSMHKSGTGKMDDGYVYEQFGMWWVFLDANRRPPIQLSGPYRTRELAEASLASLRAVVPMTSAS